MQDQTIRPRYIMWVRHINIFIICNFWPRVLSLAVLEVYKLLFLLFLGRYFFEISLHFTMFVVFLTFHVCISQCKCLEKFSCVSRLYRIFYTFSCIFLTFSCVFYISFLVVNEAYSRSTLKRSISLVKDRFIFVSQLSSKLSKHYIPIVNYTSKL